MSWRNQMEAQARLAFTHFMGGRYQERLMHDPIITIGAMYAALCPRELLAKNELAYFDKGITYLNGAVKK